MSDPVQWRCVVWVGSKSPFHGGENSVAGLKLNLQSLQTAATLGPFLPGYTPLPSFVPVVTVSSVSMMTWCPWLALVLV